RVSVCCHLLSFLFCFFFFQAEDGIRDFHVTGVQTCALPISVQPPGAPAPQSSPLWLPSPGSSSPLLPFPFWFLPLPPPRPLLPPPPSPPPPATKLPGFMPGTAIMLGAGAVRAMADSGQGSAKGIMWAVRPLQPCARPSRCPWS